MRAPQRLILEVVFALFLFALIGLAGVAPAVSDGAEVLALSNESSTTASTPPNSPVSGLVWTLATAAIGVVAILRRRTS
jgi:hypothetical protein